MDFFTILIILFFVAWFILPKLRLIKISEAAKRIREGAIMLDVRTPREFSGMNLPGSKNIPLGEPSILDLPKDRDILVYCASGMRSGNATRELKANGFTRVWNLGGISRARAAYSKSKSA